MWYFASVLVAKPPIEESVKKLKMVTAATGAIYVQGRHLLAFFCFIFGVVFVDPSFSIAYNKLQVYTCDVVGEWASTECLNWMLRGSFTSIHAILTFAVAKTKMLKRRRAA